MKERKATSFDIAYRAGVSQATVSRALRDSPLVSEATRERIKAIARELNYRVDKRAASLRSQSSQTLALLFFEDPTSDESLINPFFHTMLGNITRFAAALGYDLLVSFQSMHEDWHSKYEISRRADGIILLGYGDYLSYRSKLRQLIEREAHFIIWGPTVEDRPGCYLCCDNYSGGYDGTRHLLELGHQRIAFLGGADEHCPELKLRYAGHCQALRDAGLEVEAVLQVDADSTEGDGEAALQTLWERGQDVTALFCATDLIAMGAIRALKARGKQVPEDVSVVGFDDIPAASYMNPPLTTLHQDTQLASRYLVENLISIIHGEAVESLLIKPGLVIRGSTARAVSK